MRSMQAFQDTFLAFRFGWSHPHLRETSAMAPVMASARWRFFFPFCSLSATRFFEKQPGKAEVPSRGALRKTVSTWRRPLVRTPIDTPQPPQCIHPTKQSTSWLKNIVKRHMKALPKAHGQSMLHRPRVMVDVVYAYVSRPGSSDGISKATSRVQLVSLHDL